MIALVPIGDVDEELLEPLRLPLEEVFGQSVQIGDRIVLPQGSWNGDRGQHQASLILARLSPPPSAGDTALGVADVDIFAPGLNFVFGQAEIKGKRALISLQRLRPEFYGFPRNEDVFRERTLKEAVHELGHTHGLGHCADSGCVMHFSNSLADTDRKGWSFCSVCQEKLRHRL